MPAEERKRKTEDERIYKILKSDILTGKLLPGERIVVAQFEKEFGVSAMPIRTALKQLCQDGFVEISPHIGAQVIKPDAKQFYEISDIRCVLEPYAASLACDTLTEQDFTALEDILSEMKRCVETMDCISYSDCNNEFHSYLYDRCGNATLRDLIYQMWDLSKITRRVFPMGMQRVSESYVEHCEILRQLRERNHAEVHRLLYLNNCNGFAEVKNALLHQHQSQHQR